MNQNNLNTLSYVSENIGFQSMELDKMGMAVANYKETEPTVVQAMLGVFANALASHASHLEELAEILDSIYHSEEKGQPCDKVGEPVNPTTNFS